MKSHEIVQEYLRKYSLPDTSQRITNIFIKIFFSGKFRQKSLEKKFEKKF